MRNFSKNPKPHYLKKDEFLSPLKETSVNQDVIDELVKITRESRKQEEKLLRKKITNDRVSL